MAKATKITANLKRVKISDLLEKNAERPLRIYDTIIGGFYLLVSKTGNGVWYLEKRISRSGKSAVTFRLGKSWGGKAGETALNVTHAARKAAAWVAFCEAGKDPRKEIGTDGEIIRLAERERPKVTFDELAAYYLDKPSLSAKSKQDVISAIRNHLRPWLGKRNDISTLDDEAVFDQYHLFKESGIGMATNLMKMMSAMWNYGRPHFKDGEGNRLLGDSPVRMAKQRTDRGRWAVEPNPNKPVITIDKVGGFVAHLEERLVSLQGKTHHVAYYERCGTYALLLCLFTGMRITEATNLLWAGVDMEAGTLSIGKIKDAQNLLIDKGKPTKNRQNHTVMMSGYVKALIRDLATTRSSASDYVFPMWRQPGKPLPYPKALLKRVREDTGMYFATHAMRRTFRGVCRTQGIAEDDVRRMMNHKHVGGVTDGYDPGAFNPDMMRVDWQRVANFLETKRDLATGNERNYGQKAASLAAFMAKEGLTIEDTRKLIGYLDGELIPLVPAQGAASL